MEEVNVFAPLNMEAVVVLAAAIVAGIVLAFTLFAPFDRLFTTIHELGHVFAAILTGGEVKGFEVHFRSKGSQKGVTNFEKGDPHYIIPAGYMATAIFTTGLTLVSGLPYLAPYAVSFLGILLIFSVLRHGRSLSTAIIGLALGTGFIWVAWNSALIWSVFLLYLLAVIGIVVAIRDSRTITHLARFDPAGIHDAAQMAKLTGRSAKFWAAAWSITTFLMIAVALWFTWLRHLSA
ncbi:MAG: M50 family metallopeptidase [Anaerolineae bacterium]|nr:M50 family metallopeptidase [Anaerolineae bacterium]